MVGQTSPDSGMAQRAAPSGALADVVSDDAPRLRVLMITEGAYPYYLGGVGVWCDRLIRDLPNLDFTVLGLVGDTQVNVQYELPSNVIAHRPTVLWGVREVLETRRDLTLAELGRRRSQTSEAAVAAEFVPSFRSFLSELFAQEGNAALFSRALHGMHHFFVAYDFDTALRSQATWDCFVDTARRLFPQAAEGCGYAEAIFTLADLTEFMTYLYRWLVPIATAPPRADVVHAVSDGLPALAGMIAKLEYGMPFLLTEHGVFLRERYLAEADGSASFFVKLLGLRFGRRVTELSYLLADQIAPASNFNTRWELEGGAPRDRMRTIYNGVDPATFIPVTNPPGSPPTVVWVGRITPIKDLVTLIEAAALVHEQRPDIKFRLYGTAPAGDEAYFETCRALTASLGIEDVVVFGGFASSAEAAFNEGDLVALSSISEGFPYSVLEAMLCARPLVATAVGGVPEAIEGCGIAVEPRNPSAMADAILELMNDPERRLAYGRAARERATLHFNLRQCAKAYEYSFRMLTETGPLPMPEAAPQPVPVAEPDRATTLTAAAAAPGGEQAPLVDQGVRLAAIKRISVVPVATVDQALLWRIRNQTEPATGSSNGHSHGSFDGHSTGSTGTVGGNGHLAAGTETQSNSESGPDHEQVATLTTQAAERMSQPVDKLEVAAVLESMGLTDSVAQQRYRTRDVFDLAERVLARMRRTGLPVKARMPKPEPPESLRTVLMDYLRGPLSLGPILILLVIIAAYRELGHWGQGQVLAFSLGMTGSMLLTNCFIQAMARRGSIYLSRLNPRAAQRFLGIVVLITAGVVLGIGLAWMLVSNWTNLFAFEDRIIFAFAFTGLSAVWVMAGLLAIVQKPAWLGLGLGIGLPAGIAADLATAGLTPAHLAIGSVTGLLVALGIMLHPVARALSSPTGAPNQTRPQLPAAAYLLREAAPYFAYGGLYMVFILVPHLIGWTGALEPGQSRLGAGTGLELGLTLALGPIILVGGVAERAARLFWSHNRINQTLIHGSQAEAFGQSLFNFYRRHLARYLLALLAVSVAAYAGYFAVQQWSPLGRGYENATYFFVLGIIGYLVLAWGLFNSLFAIALGRPVFPLKALLVALLLTVAVGVPLSLSFSYMFAAVSFIVGAAAYGAVTFWEVLRLCRSADYYYFSSF